MCRPPAAVLLQSFLQGAATARDEAFDYRHVRIEWPSPILAHGTVLVDSPGLNESDMFDEVVRKHLPNVGSA